MAKKGKAIYAPGELDRLRNRLGVADVQEAKRMAAVLGGEVGVERDEENSEKTRPVKKAGPAAGPEGTGRHQPKHRIELAFNEDEAGVLKEAAARRPADPADDPLIPVKASYLERVKMDRFCSLPEFRIKSAAQVFMAMLSIFGEPPDLVNPAFINKKINSYYGKLEQLVTSVRTLFPRNNMKRNEKIKRLSPFAYSVLDTLRYWNLEKMASDMAKIQAHPRNATVSEFTGILKIVYRPLFILEHLGTDLHIKNVFKLLYKILYVENPTEAKEKAQGLIREALGSFNEVRQDIHYYLYPLLMKLLSDRFIPYETFFSARRNRFMDFIDASEADQIDPAGMAAELGAGKNDIIEEDAGEKNENSENSEEESGKAKEEDPSDPELIKDKEKKAAQEKERKAILQGVASLEALFPKAGWERLSSSPDIYPYFREIYNFKRNYELISPADPLLQAVVVMRILEDLFLGLRNVHFGTAVSGEGGPVQVNEILNGILGSWQNFIDIALEKEYLSRLGEYCRILEQSIESRSSNYAKRLLCELHWIKRLFFFPYYKFDTLFPPPFQRKDIEPAYPVIRSLRRSLALVAAGIEQANRIGGAEKMVPCDGIDNPWEPYEFAIPNPVSTRLNALLPPKKQNNATLVFFSLAFATVLDHLVNDENSWAYREGSHILFRNLNNVPQIDIDNKKIDADALFEESLRQRENP
ncbi:MAG: hypothetical protein LBG07_07990 [Treponema sp.]|jgi:hypothetical protein|nr:hypothetical protein [Treponema sp.]